MDGSIVETRWRDAEDGVESLHFYRQGRIRKERSQLRVLPMGAHRATLDLRAFLLRNQVLRLFRSALRSARRAPPSAREELVQTVRAEIQQNRSMTNPQQIRFLISDGRQRLKELNTMLGIQGHD